MKQFLAGLIFIAMSTYTMAQTLVMDKEYEVGKPIILSVTDLPQVPDATLSTLWKIDGAEKREFGNVVAVWGAPNADGSKKAVSVVCITRLTKRVKIDGTEYDLEIPGSFKFLENVFYITGKVAPVPPGPNPPGPTPPNPNPNIPDDQFGNIGKTLYGWVQAVPEASRVKHTDLAVIYSRAANMVLTSKTEAVNDFIQSERQKIINTQQLQSDWSQVGNNINKDIESRQFANRVEVSAYYNALANGFK